MLNMDSSLVIAAIAGVTTAAAVSLHFLSLKAQRRAFELRAANKAMRAYYALLEEIVDDPALPNDAAEFLSVFAEILADKKTCFHFTTRVFLSKGNGSKEAGNRLFKEIEALGASRPDLRDKFHRAIANGIIAIFHRWPGNSWKYTQIMQEVASDPKKEFQLVTKLAKEKSFPLSRDHAIA